MNPDQTEQHHEDPNSDQNVDHGFDAAVDWNEHLEDVHSKANENEQDDETKHEDLLCAYDDPKTGLLQENS